MRGLLRGEKRTSKKIEALQLVKPKEFLCNEAYIQNFTPEAYRGVLHILEILQ